MIFKLGSQAAIYQLINFFSLRDTYSREVYDRWVKFGNAFGQRIMSLLLLIMKEASPNMNFRLNDRNWKIIGPIWTAKIVTKRQKKNSLPTLETYRLEWLPLNGLQEIIETKLNNCIRETRAFHSMGLATIQMMKTIHCIASNEATLHND